MLEQSFNVIATESFLQSITTALRFSVNHMQVMFFLNLEMNGCVALKIVGCGFFFFFKDDLENGS